MHAYARGNACAYIHKNTNGNGNLWRFPYLFH